MPPTNHFHLFVFLLFHIQTLVSQDICATNTNHPHPSVQILNIFTS